MSNAQTKQKKVPEVFRDFLSSLVIFFNNKLLLIQSRPGLKKEIIKVKPIVIEHHSLDSIAKEKPFLSNPQPNSDFFGANVC
jgi:hypothetical protein